ncbi:TonB-dependent receptor [Marinilongibacter aquaticus]|uniref:TonB-dependent receptor n=1 Tax=Marinilongibacter aquaticus TaxID=2975157 RepID=UPI0021BD17B8|nr:TonB-dependent receptor [Marinilongibacter aquaticus]UBM60592.1 TonB-dependent receptor [Marinilongibacter aquaticus]
MKLTSLLLFVSLFQVSAAVFSQPVSLHFKNSEFQRVFHEIRKQTGYNFLYNNRLLKNTHPVSFSGENMDLKVALDKIFEGQPITYAIIDKTIVVKKREGLSNENLRAIEQKRNLFADASRKDLPSLNFVSGKLPEAQNATIANTITGSITDDNGEAIPGVSIVVKGTQIGTSSNANGRYSINVPDENAVLAFSFVGYKSQEILVGNRSIIDVTMVTDNQTLEEVVVVGYGEMKRADLTTAQTSVSSKDIEKTVNTTIEQAIQGRAAGVYITQNSGQPGGGISVNIRGVNSINGTNEPLYVVDGVQIPGQSAEYGAQSSSNPLAGLNPSDIESIEVLQGPSATAIYGSRATNGVLLITTKRGKEGDAKLAYGFQYSIQTAPRELDVMNLQQYAQMVKEYHDIAGGETPQEFLDPSLLGKGTDWQKELFKSAPMSKHQLSLSGGSAKSTYYLSGEYLDQDGVAIGSGFDRYGIRLNLDSKPRSWATFGANFNFNQTNENLTTSQENVISNALQLSPQIPVKNLDGTWGGGDANNGANIYTPVNPIAIATMTTNKLVRRQILGGLNVGLQLAKGLQFRTSFNTNLGFANSSYYVPTYKIGWAENVTAKLTSGANVNTYWNWNQLLQYDRHFGKHGLNVMASHESQSSSWKNLSASRTGFLTNDILDLNAGDALTASNGGGSGVWAMESYLGRLNYNFDDRYIVMGTLRADGSANFGDDNKWGIFPSVSAAWRISQEPFFNSKVINELKLRLETGVTGNQGSGGIYAPMTTAPTPTGTGFLPSRYSNQGLKWEETKTDNIGLNVALFKNRIQFEFDYYVKNTDNLLMGQPLPWYMGTNGTGSVGAPTVNIGSLQNKGFGFTLNTVNYNSGGFKWASNFNISSFKTKIKAFYSDNAFVDRTSWWLNDWTQRSEVGSAPWLFRGYIEEGIFGSISEIEDSALPVDNNGDEKPIDENNIWVGDVKFKDVNGDGIINEKDITTIGNPWPKFFAGFTNTFSYKGFDLSVLFTSTYGNDIYNQLARVNSNPNQINLSRNLMLKAMDYARPITDDNGQVVLANPGTTVARINNSDANGNYTNHTSKWVEDGSFLRLKNVTLSYNIPSAFLEKQKVIKGARCSVSGQNIWTWTGYSGFDPEVGAYVGRDVSTQNQAIGLDYGRYPLTPVYSFSVNLDF